MSTLAPALRKRLSHVALLPMNESGGCNAGLL